MNMFARFDENPAMTLRVIKETKRYGRTDARTDGQRENSIPPTNKVCGGYNIRFYLSHDTKINLNHIFGVKLSMFCHLLCNVIMDIFT